MLGPDLDAANIFVMNSDAVPVTYLGTYLLHGVNGPKNLQTITNGCGKKPGFESEINQEGCLTKFEGLFVGNMGIVGGESLLEIENADPDLHDMYGTVPVPIYLMIRIHN